LAPSGSELVNLKKEFFSFDTQKSDHHQLKSSPALALFSFRNQSQPLVVLVRREGPSPVFLNVTPVTTIQPPPVHHQDDDGRNLKGTASFTTRFGGVFIFINASLVSYQGSIVDFEVKCRRGPGVERLSI